ncbi:hypothetical protein ABTZ03_33365 [Kitasatospora sp. NPDC096077]|uniref:hypothetical protein n=1 Tax=Kitasatospora sp. NPDC096077 TaxID=3155544 RepID=UPI0033349870
MKTTKTMRHMAMTATAGILALTGTMTAAGTAQADSLDPEQQPRITVNDPFVLYQGQSLDTGKTRLILQSDGDLVLYRTDNRYEWKWSMDTKGCGNRAILQGDGNFVVYGNYNNNVCKATNTYKDSPNDRATLEVWGYGGLRIKYTSRFESSGGTVELKSTDPY